MSLRTRKDIYSAAGIVNIPKEPQKNVSMYIVKIDESYFKGFEAMTYLDELESKFNQELKQWKKENK